MELTYTVRGADGKEYGPVTTEQITAWIREGRVNSHQSIRRSDMEQWAPAQDFIELQPLLPSSAAGGVAVTPSGAATPRDASAVAQLKSGASWFYWIAALSLINSISAATGSSWRFIVGLGITQIFDELGNHMGTGGRWVALALDLLAASVFVLFGVFAHKAHQWPFIAGMILFALDGVIFLLGPDWLGVAFHGFVLYCLFRGFRACRALRP
jgi:hypothetical protein